MARDYDDGGLLDLNNLSASALETHGPLERHVADQLVEVRNDLGRFADVNEVLAYVDLPEGTASTPGRCCLRLSPGGGARRHGRACGESLGFRRGPRSRSGCHSTRCGWVWGYGSLGPAPQTQPSRRRSAIHRSRSPRASTSRSSPIRLGARGGPWRGMSRAPRWPTTLLTALAKLRLDSLTLVGSSGQGTSEG